MWQLVAEERRAFHAGVSHWRGHAALNGRSIGIEIVNPGHEWGYRPFPALQMAAVCELCLGVLARHPIPARNVVGHSDVAPDRKEDPGELFDWPGLAENGVGLWPGSGAEPVAESAVEAGAAPRSATRSPISPRRCVAFQRHWRPARVDGVADRDTRARIADLLRALDPAAVTRPSPRAPDGRAAAASARGWRKVRAPREHGAG